MVKATVNAGVVNLESILEITEGQRDKIKTNPVGVKNVLNDMHVEHFLSVTEDGTIVSKIGHQIQGEFNLETVTLDMREKHQKFLEWVDGLPEPGDNNNSANSSSIGFFIIPMFV